MHACWQCLYSFDLPNYFVFVLVCPGQETGFAVWVFAWIVVYVCQERIQRFVKGGVPVSGACCDRTSVQTNVCGHKRMAPATLKF